MNEFTQSVIKFIKSIPKGKVATYGSIAKICGKPTGARQVSRILHTQTKKHKLPWHRIINSQGKISLTGDQYHIQKGLLESEGVQFSKSDVVDLKKYHI